MKRLILFVLIFISACKAKLPDIPKDVMPMDKMEAILTDMHVADAVAESKGQVGLNEKLLTEEYHQQIFSNHGTTRAEFLKSFKFYESNPLLLDIVYDSVLVDLSKREEAAGKQ